MELFEAIRRDHRRKGVSGTDSELLTASLHRFVGTDGYDSGALRLGMARFAFLLSSDDGVPLFGLDSP